MYEPGSYIPFLSIRELRGKRSYYPTYTSFLVLTLIPICPGCLKANVTKTRCFSSTGGNPTAGSWGRREKKRHHESFPKYPDWYSGPDWTAEWAKHEAVSGEHGARRETEEHYWSVWAQRGGKCLKNGRGLEVFLVPLLFNLYFFRGSYLVVLRADSKFCAQGSLLAGIVASGIPLRSATWKTSALSTIP